MPKQENGFGGAHRESPHERLDGLELSLINIVHELLEGDEKLSSTEKLGGLVLDAGDDLGALRRFRPTVYARLEATAREYINFASEQKSESKVGDFLDKILRQPGYRTFNLLSNIFDLISKEKPAAPTHERAQRAGEFSYNRDEAERLGLEPLRLEAYPEADQLINRILLKPDQPGYLDISTPAGQDKFCLEWNRLLPTLPPPCMPRKTVWKQMKIFHGVDYPPNINKAEGNFWYLNKLKAEKIITNLLDKKQSPSGAPAPNTLVKIHFGEPEFLLVDSWEEKDYNAADAPAVHQSALLKELTGNASAVNRKREEVDVALWEGDTVNRKPTAKHKEILTSLGVNPNNYELHCIRQDEYARGLVAKDWGNKELTTNFDHYFLEGDDRLGLASGNRLDGGAALVGRIWRGYADSSLAVRLVLSRKR